MKRKRQSLLKEKDEIVNWRHRYLRDIRRIREDGKKIYYLDETWVNAGHTVNADMNADLFEKWFKNILPHLQENNCYGQCFLP